MLIINTLHHPNNLLFHFIDFNKLVKDTFHFQIDYIFNFTEMQFRYITHNKKYCL